MHSCPSTPALPAAWVHTCAGALLALQQLRPHLPEPQLLRPRIDWAACWAGMRSAAKECLPNCKPIPVPLEQTPATGALPANFLAPCHSPYPARPLRRHFLQHLTSTLRLANGGVHQLLRQSKGPNFSQLGETAHVSVPGQQAAQVGAAPASPAVKLPSLLTLHTPRRSHLQLSHVLAQHQLLLACRPLPALSPRQPLLQVATLCTLRCQQLLQLVCCCSRCGCLVAQTIHLCLQLGALLPQLGSGTAAQRPRGRCIVNQAAQVLK